MSSKGAYEKLKSDNVIVTSALQVTPEMVAFLNLTSDTDNSNFIDAYCEYFTFCGIRVHGSYIDRQQPSR
jgi:hypothetical protein